jgi:NitT/TauT family transport system substrate-binding protein
MALLGRTRFGNAGVAVVATLTMALSCGVVAAQTAIKFTLDSNLMGPVAPFTVGIDKGYYATEELQVTIDTNRNPSDVLKHIASDAYGIGFVDLNALIRFRDQNPQSPIKAVFMVYNRPAYAVIGRKSRGVVWPKNLEGKKLGAPAADPAYAQLPIFLQANGIKLSGVTVVNTALAVREPMLAAGEVDAVTGLSFATYIDVKERGVPVDDVSMMLMADYGVHLYGSAIVINPEFSSARADVVKAFLRAFLKSLKNAVGDPAAAVESVIRRDDVLTAAVELARLQLAIEQSIRTPEVTARGYGLVDMDRLEKSIEQMGLTYSFKTKPKAEDIFDPSFLPSAGERQVQ